MRGSWRGVYLTVEKMWESSLTAKKCGEAWGRERFAVKESLLLSLAIYTPVQARPSQKAVPRYVLLGVSHGVCLRNQLYLSSCMQPEWIRCWAFYVYDQNSVPDQRSSANCGYGEATLSHASQTPPEEAKKKRQRKTQKKKTISRRALPNHLRPRFP